MEDIDRANQLREEEERKQELKERFNDEEIKAATDAVVKYEVSATYYETIWKKGLILLDELDKLGYKITKKPINS